LAIRLTRPFAPFRYLAETNATPFTSTFTWTSHRLNRGCALALSFPPRLSCDRSPTYNHHLTLTGLKPQAIPVILQSGANLLIFPIDHRFIPQDLPPLPNPAYGKVVTADTLQPLPGAIVKVTTPQGIVSAPTNAQGAWAVDLAGSYPATAVFPVTIDWQYLHFQNHIISLKQYQPAPNFTLPVNP